MHDGMEKNMKKITAFLLAASVMLSTGAYAEMFYDTKGHWAEQAIDELAQKNIINGVDDGYFSPDSVVTRAQYLKMIMGVTGIAPEECGAEGCLDVTPQVWYSSYLNGAMVKGLIPKEMIASYDSSVVDGTVKYTGAFNGDTPITREEMAFITMSMYQYILNANTMKTLAPEQEIEFEDSGKITPWAVTGVKLAAANGIIKGNDGRFDPTGKTTRAQAAAVILRVMNKLQAEG